MRGKFANLNQIPCAVAKGLQRETVLLTAVIGVIAALWPGKTYAMGERVSATVQAGEFVLLLDRWRGQGSSTAVRIRGHFGAKRVQGWCTVGHRRRV